MSRIALTPGTVGLAALAIELVGIDNVFVGANSFDAVYIFPEFLKKEDVDAAIELIQERGREKGMHITATEVR